MSSLQLKDNLLSIGDFAFSKSGLLEADLLNVQSIGKRAF